MKYYRLKTLSFYYAAPHFKLLDLGARPVKAIADATLEYRKTCGTVQPEEEAVEFYAFNHMASVIRRLYTPSEILPEWAAEVMEWYMTVLAGQTKRQFLYIASICCREARHTKPLSAATTQHFAQHANSSFQQFIEAVKSNGSEDVAVKRFMSNPPDCNNRQFFMGMSGVFHINKWDGGYGGHPWGQIADCGKDFVMGKTTAEMMVDTAYTLEHNNGSMYNKGMMYDHYNSSTQMRMILDCQRAGQVPNLVLDSKNWGIDIQESVKERVKKFAEKVPGEFQGWVDWHTVMSLGAKGSYESQKIQQEKLHPVKVDQSVLLKKLGVNAPGLQYVGKYEYFPSQSVPTFKRTKTKVMV